MTEEIPKRDYAREEWGAGEWQNEPDYLSWTDEETGMACLVVRSYSGALCGYVAVEEGHPYYNVEYDDVKVQAHGGLTYSDFCGGAICHVPEPGKPDNVWWLGFDCGHAGDICPRNEQLAVELGMPRSLFKIGVFGETPTYKNIEFVQSEVKKLARQLKAWEGKAA